MISSKPLTRPEWIGPAPRETEKPEKILRQRENILRLESSRRRALALGDNLSWARPVARFLQRLVKETTEPLIIIGAVIVFIVSPRRALFLSGVPLYCLLVQSTMHLEFRYTLAMHYFLFVFAAAAWVRIGAHASRLVKTTVRWPGARTEG